MPLYLKSRPQVSIHAPARGATGFLGGEGCGQDVSIHAPARGATRQPSPGGPGTRFQSTHPHGVRLIIAGHQRWKAAFQSTHPHGVRLHREYQRLRAELFQSTHPHGVRLYVLLCLLVHMERFNPRTRTGCDAWSRRTTKSGSGFNPRTRTGCDWIRRR